MQARVLYRRQRKSSYSALKRSLFKLVLLFIGLPAVAQTSLSGMIINAEDYEYNSKEKIAILKENVRVVFDGNHLRADEARIDTKNKMIYAKGNVILQNPESYIGADSIEFNYQKKTGLFFNSFVRSGQAVFEGQVIEKTGEKTFEAEYAQYTTCETCPAAWSFSGRKISAELGGYAWLTRPWLRVGGVPIFFLPGMVIPLKSKRQSGFLVPSYSYTSQGGNAVSLPYFWALSRNKDLTLTAKNYEKRGFKALGEYRYVTSETNYGSLSGSHIKDRAIVDGQNITTEQERWYMNYSHYYELPGNLIHRVNLLTVSDLRYPVDFPREVDANGDPAIKNKMSITKLGQSQFASVEGVVNINMLQENPLGSNEGSVHRLPEINYSLTQTRVFDSELLVELDMNYVNFARKGLAYDDMVTIADGRFVKKERDGSFDPADGDLIRTGQRLDIRPAISYPIIIGNIINVVPKVTYRDTQYYFNLGSDDPSGNYSNSAARQYLQTDIALGTQFSKIFGGVSQGKKTTYKHEVEPEVSYSTIPWINNPDHQFFGNFENQPIFLKEEAIRDADLNGDTGIQFDYNDRVFDTRLVNFSLTHKIVRKRYASDKPDYRRLIFAKISQIYDLNEAKENVNDSTDKTQPWQPIYGLLDVRLDNFDSYTSVVNYPYANTTNFNSRVRGLHASGAYLELFYSSRYDIQNNNVRDESSKTSNVGVGLGFVSKYINLSGKVDYSLIAKEFIPWKFAAFIKPPGDCWGFYFTGSKDINGDEFYDYRVSFNFSGD